MLACSRCPPWFFVSPTREPTPRPSSRYKSSQYHSQPPQASSRFDTQSLPIAMSVASPEPVVFTAAEKLKIVIFRKKEGWDNIATEVEPQPRGIYLIEANIPRGPVPLNFHNLALILMRDRGDGVYITAPDVATEYSHLRSENECDYTEMLRRLRALRDAIPEPSTSGSGSRRRGQAVAIAPSPAPESSTYSASPRMPRSFGRYDPRAPPIGGRWARHEFFAGKYKSWR